MKLARITTYPVKSLHGTDLALGRADVFGLRGDRRWAVIFPNGKVATRRELSRLALMSAVETPQGISISYEGARLDVPFPHSAPVKVKVFSTEIDGVEDAGNYASHFLSSALEHEVRLVYFPDTAVRPVSRAYAGEGHFTALADGYPILLATQASLEELNAELASPVEMQRFRPNLVISGDLEPWAEDTWRRIKIGSAVLRVVKPCERCVMVTQDPNTGVQTDPREPLATLGRIHRAANGKIIFGQNVVVEEEGDMILGDQLEVLESGTSNLFDFK
ncbi:MOSC domain-containing protein [Celeribacter litoreus]|uniref:MOSC domain-containing protein n=1 Tax=Celeribacter litoreus TaxID=2876714 RepID=UPI001CCFF257|nr:MOSC domain-containing protein [Celeribacter litoreus]MCA0042323.1 MOSC domain-containing protein [Celeribacter litoreus]